MKTSPAGIKFIAEFEDPDKPLQTLTRSIEVAEYCINDFVKVKLTQNEFDALVSFVYSVNPPASKPLVLLNSGKYEEVPAEIKKYVHVDGKVDRDIVRRRIAEALLFETNPVS